MVVGEVSKSNAEVVDELIKSNLLNRDSGLDGDFRTPKDVVPLDCSAEKMKEPMIFSPIQI